LLFPLRDEPQTTNRKGVFGIKSNGFAVADGSADDKFLILKVSVIRFDYVEYRDNMLTTNNPVQVFHLVALNDDYNLHKSL
jgi:hypothetical protein